jgi:hypothetical protein
MGLFDRLRGRRQSEDALAQARAEVGPAAEVGPLAPVKSDSGEVIGKPIDQAGFDMGAMQIPGLENMGALGPIIQHAIEHHQAQVISPQFSAYVQNASEMQKDMMAVLAKHGFDPTSANPQAIQVASAGFTQDMFAAMQKHGFDPNQFGAPGGEPTPGT